MRDALEVQRKAYPPGHLELARTETALGEVLAARGQRQEGEALLREALAVRRRKCPAGDWRIGETASALGGALLQAGRDGEAGPLLQEGYATLRAALGESYPLTLEARRRLERAAAPPVRRAGR